MWKREPYNIPDAIFFVLASCVSLASYVVLALAYNSLPDLVPVHYGINGQVDAVTDKTFMSVFGIAFIHFSVSVLIMWLYSHPQYANIPGRVPLAKLPKKYRHSIEWIIRHMAMMMFVLVSLIFSYLALSGVVIGLNFARELNVLPLGALVFLLVTINGIYFVMINRIATLAAQKKKLPIGW
jgi:uncharacterized membrane protein